MNKNIDLNLLKVLVLLNRHRNIKPVSQELGKSEASISKYLTRLREQMEDELFVRHAHHLEPTYELQRMLPELELALGLLEACVQKKKFIPEMYEGNIVIGLPQVIQYNSGHLILEELIDFFPRATIDIHSGFDPSEKHLIEDKFDVRVDYFNEELPKTIYQKFIGYASPCLVVSKKLGVKSIEEACNHKFILLGKRGWKDQLTIMALKNKGYQTNCVATVNNITSLLKIIKSQKAVTILFEKQEPKEGLDFITIPECYFNEGKPKVVIQMKQVNRYNPLHQLVCDIVTRNIFH